MQDAQHPQHVAGYGAIAAVGLTQRAAPIDLLFIRHDRSLPHPEVSSRSQAPGDRATMRP